MYIHRLIFWGQSKGISVRVSSLIGVSYCLLYLSPWSMQESKATSKTIWGENTSWYFITLSLLSLSYVICEQFPSASDLHLLNVSKVFNLFFQHLLFILKDFKPIGKNPFLHIYQLICIIYIETTALLLFVIIFCAFQ